MSSAAFYCTTALLLLLLLLLLLRLSMLVESGSGSIQVESDVSVVFRQDCPVAGAPAIAFSFPVAA